MRKLVVYSTGILLGMLIYLSIINFGLLTSTLNLNNHYLGKFKNQFYFDNGKEIWVEEFRIIGGNK